MISGLLDIAELSPQPFGLIYPLTPEQDEAWRGLYAAEIDYDLATCMTPVVVFPDPDEMRGHNDERQSKLDASPLYREALANLNRARTTFWDAIRADPRYAGKFPKH